MPPIVPIENLKREISLLADQCVKCGLCSAKCPTYKLHADENESPRGRIALAQAVANDSIQSFDRIKHHLDNCLYCAQCETACPSGVKYTRIVDLTLNALKHSPNGLKTSQLELWGIRFISKQTENSWPLLIKTWTLLSPIINRYLFRKLKIKPSIVNKKRHEPTIINHQPPFATKGSLSIFTGCTSHIFDQRTLADSMDLLRHCGYALNVSKRQGCCGALAKHRGYSDLANNCEIRNTQAFGESSTAPIIFSATGCGAALQQYDSSLSQRSIDINTFAKEQLDFNKLSFNPLNKKILIHSPCSQQKTIAKNKTIEALLLNIPGIEILQSDQYNSCCGAGGTHFVRSPDTAAKIRDPLINRTIKHAPDYVVSSNYSCAMHIATGLSEKNMDIPVIHPISLLWQQLDKNNV